jgi:D-alanine-D-alanine ligase
MSIDVISDNQWHAKLKTPVAVLLGGSSAEREVSLRSGEAVVTALKSQNILAHTIDTIDSRWLDVVAKDYQHAFIALHGGDGEDGTVQAALENIGVSYTGSGVASSALAMDKIRSKTLWLDTGLPTPEFSSLNDNSHWSDIISAWGKVIVKPSHEGSSIGMAIATSADELQQAYSEACQYDASVMAEKWVSGAEFTVAVLGNKALPAIRLETDHSFYDYEAKYISEDTRYICPCGLELEQENALKKLALIAFDSLGCRGWGRVDFMQDELNNFQLLEVNTVPGMTSHSLVPMAADAAGISFEQLVASILRISLD